MFDLIIITIQKEGYFVVWRRRRSVSLSAASVYVLRVSCVSLSLIPVRAQRNKVFINGLSVINHLYLYLNECEFSDLGRLECEKVDCESVLLYLVIRLYSQ